MTEETEKCSLSMAVAVTHVSWLQGHYHCTDETEYEADIILLSNSFQD